MHHKRRMEEQMEVDQAREAQQQLLEVLGANTPSSLGGAGKKLERDDEPGDKEAESLPKYQRGQHKGMQSGGGKGWRQTSSSQDWWSKQSRGSQDPWAASAAENKVPDTATQQLLRTLVKMVTRHEEELARIRIDTNFMLFMDVMPEGVYDLMKLTAEKWHEKYTAKQVTMSLRVMLMLALLGEIQDRMSKTVADDDQLQRCINVGWMAEGSTRLNPVYLYHRWNPETRTQEKSDHPPLTHMNALSHMQTLQEMIVQPNVLTRFRSTRPLAKDPKGEVVPFLLSLSLRQCQAEKCHSTLTALSGCACLKLAGVRLRPDRGQKQPLMKELEQAYLGVPYTDWTQRDPSWNRPQRNDKSDEKDQ
ncbi:unnamed protein product [Symbiodinium sp. KB8]|nr:unnamed protein product [Symbiodinium sp. KB8]